MFPAFSIGIASYLAVLEGLWLCRKGDTYLKLFDCWKKILAVAFGMCVVSSIVDELSVWHELERLFG